MLDQAVNYREVKKEPVDLHKLCTAIRTDLNYYEGASQIEFILDCPKDFTLLADPDRIKIVISNLMSNAIKYRRLDIQNPMIVIRARQEGTIAKIEVEDNGLGIEEKSVGRIFDMFVRVSDQSHGSGLGLYIVKDMMKKMGGNIMVDSEYGKGTTFTLTLPQDK
jgi:signal transduction histidine kinase